MSLEGICRCFTAVVKAASESIWTPSTPHLTPQQNPESTLSSLEKPQSPYKKVMDTLSSLWQFLLRHTFLGYIFSPAKEEPPVMQETQKEDLHSVQDDFEDSATTSSPPIPFRSPEEELQTQALSQYKEATSKGTIHIAWRTTYYIGRDQSFSFATTIQLLSGDFLKVNPNDRIHRCVINIPNQQPKEIELPSSLFSQACIDNQLWFILENHLYVLTLTPFLHQYITGRIEEVSVDECLKTGKQELNYSTNRFFDDEDVPLDYYQWGKNLFAGVYLSPQAKYIELGTDNVVPLNSSRLQPISSDLPSPKILWQGEKKYEYCVKLAACGKPRIDIVYDQNLLHIHLLHRDMAERFPDLKKTGYITLRSELPMELFLVGSLYRPKKAVDVDRIKASLDDTGILTIYVPYISKPDEELSDAAL